MSNIKTDWDSYYNKAYKTASYSRSITGHYLLNELSLLTKGRSFSIAELGGGNSAFFSRINEKLRPKHYALIDNNETGLLRFKERIPSLSHVDVFYGDVLQGIHCSAEKKFDIVYSIGLIEHFDREGTAKAIETHFSLLKDGGHLIITYPTPTFLYRATRYFSELFGLWIFHDERPLGKEEVEREVLRQGDIKKHYINYPIILTQGIIVAQKR